jgi:hypothetical protein
MVFDPSLADPFGLIVEIALLKELGVESFYYLAPGAINTNAKHIIYFVRPEYIHITTIITIITIIINNR